MLAPGGIASAVVGGAGVGVGAPRGRHSPCPASLCEVGDWRSAVTTSADVRIEAVAVVPGDAPAGEERRLTVRLNVSNLGVTGLPICPHGALWLLWEVGGTAKGRFREVAAPLPSRAAPARRCLARQPPGRREVSTGEVMDWSGCTTSRGLL